MWTYDQAPPSKHRQIIIKSFSHLQGSCRGETAGKALQERDLPSMPRKRRRPGRSPDGSQGGGFPGQLQNPSPPPPPKPPPENPPPPSISGAKTKPPKGRNGPGRSGSANGCAAFCALADAALVAPSAARKPRRETRGSCTIAFCCVRPPWQSVQPRSAARLPPHPHQTIQQAFSSWCRPIPRHPQS